MPKTKPAPGSALLYAGNEGGEPSVPNVPARDLTDADLERLAADPFIARRYAATAEDLAAFLLGTGIYAAAAPADSKGVTTDG